MSGFIYRQGPLGGSIKNTRQTLDGKRAGGKKLSAQSAPKWRPEEKALVVECLERGVLHME